MDKEEGGEQNMISNLPLLFASGYPTSLDKITETQLENFIPFMVQCSLGHINMQGQIKCGEPEWWPEDVPYVTPFTKPRKFTGNWMDKMKEIVIICYQFHKSVFLLKFCNDLASYEHASLRFINNYNSTTSLFDRRNNKLLVTFRNENMSYDQPQRGRKCLLKKKKTDRTNEGEMESMMVEPAPFDIYLCDNCDAELYSKEAILEHEKTCNVDTDDVILCDSPEPEQQTEVEQASNIAMKSLDEKEEMRNIFLLNFNLQSVVKTNVTPLSGKTASPSKPMNEEDIIDNALKRRRRLTRRSRTVHSLTRCPTIPLSSPAGMLLLRTNAPGTTHEYITERLERVERFCHAPALIRGIPKPKYMEKRYVPNVTNITYKKPAENSAHIYTFPRRQFAQRRRAEEVTLALLRRCRPISVRLKKLSPDQEVKRSITSKRHTIANTNGISNSSSNLNIKLKRDTGRSCSWKISKPSGEIIVDTIDLCSSDEEEERKKREKEKEKDDRNAKLIESVKKAVLNRCSDDLQIKVGGITITPSVSTKTADHPLRMRSYTVDTDTNLRPSGSLNGAHLTREAQLSTIYATNRQATVCATTTEINNTIIQARQAKPSVFFLPYYKNASTASSALFDNNNHGKPTMLTDTLPLSNSGHNRQNNHVLNNNSSNGLLLSTQTLKTTARIKKVSSTTTTTTIASAAAAVAATTQTTTGVSPAQWLGSASLNNNNNIKITNNNNNKFIVNNNNQLITENTIILDPVVPSTTIATTTTTTANANSNNHKNVDTRTSTNINHIQKRVIIDLTH